MPKSPPVGPTGSGRPAGHGGLPSALRTAGRCAAVVGITTGSLLTLMTGGAAAAEAGRSGPTGEPPAVDGSNSERAAASPEPGPVDGRAVAALADHAPLAGQDESAGADPPTVELPAHPAAALPAAGPDGGDRAGAASGDRVVDPPQPDPEEVDPPQPDPEEKAGSRSSVPDPEAPGPSAARNPAPGPAPAQRSTPAVSPAPEQEPRRTGEVAAEGDPATARGGSGSARPSDPSQHGELDGRAAPSTDPVHEGSASASARSTGTASTGTASTGTASTGSDGGRAADPARTPHPSAKAPERTGHSPQRESEHTSGGSAQGSAHVPEATGTSPERAGRPAERSAEPAADPTLSSPGRAPDSLVEVPRRPAAAPPGGEGAARVAAGVAHVPDHRRDRAGRAPRTTERTPAVVERAPQVPGPGRFGVAEGEARVDRQVDPGSRAAVDPDPAVSAARPRSVPGGPNPLDALRSRAAVAGPFEVPSGATGRPRPTVRPGATGAANLLDLAPVRAAGPPAAAHPSSGETPPTVALPSTAGPARVPNPLDEAEARTAARALGVPVTAPVPTATPAAPDAPGTGRVLPAAGLSTWSRGQGGAPPVVVRAVTGAEAAELLRRVVLAPPHNPLDDRADQPARPGRSGVGWFTPNRPTSVHPAGSPTARPPIAGAAGAGARDRSGRSGPGFG